MIVETVVSDVSVFLSGAVVRRSGSVELRKGRNTFSVAGLPKYVDRSSVRLIVHGCPINGTMSIEDLFREADSDSKEELEQVHRELEHLDREAELNRSVFAMFRANGDLSHRTQSDPQQTLNYLDRIAQKLADCNAELDGIEDRKRQLSEKEKLLEAAVGRKREYERTVVTITLTTEQPGSYQTTLEYRDQNVRWKPYYEIHIPSIQKGAEMELYGVVSQNTLEDWKDVSLSLLTGKPEQTQADTMELRPWTLSSFCLTPPLSSAPAYSMSGASANMETMVLSEEAVSDSPAAHNDHDAVFLKSMAMAVNENALAVEYKVEDKWNVYRDTDGIRVKLDSYQTQTEYRYRTIPKLEQKARLTAYLGNLPVSRILYAKADVFFENKYTGSVEINPQLIKDTLIVPVGTDNSLRITRRQLEKSKMPVRIYNKKRRKYIYEINVVNYKDTDIQIEVLDQIPVSEEKQIVVECQNCSGAAIDSHTGEVKWTQRLPAMQQVTYLLQFSVTSPQNMTVYEGGRVGNDIFSPPMF